MNGFLEPEFFFMIISHICQFLYHISIPNAQYVEMDPELKLFWQSLNI